MFVPKPLRPSTARREDAWVRKPVPFRPAMRGWIAATACLLLTLGASAAIPAQGLLREVWEGTAGGSVANLTSSPDYPGRPTSANYVTDVFEAPTDVLDNYGQRLHGYVVPPISGSYTFWIASDDGGALFLSTDDNPANSRQVANVAAWTSSREWGKEASQKSAPIPLSAGKAYYISALMKEAGGGDNLAVRWLMPNGVDQAPIVATNLLPFGFSFTAPVIARQPGNLTAVEGGDASFTVQLTAASAAAYQWRRDGSALPGEFNPSFRLAPVRLADSGARFSVLVTNQQGSVLSSEALLTVTPDVTAPTPISIENVGTTLLRIRFDEPIAPDSATATANYALAPAVPITSARIADDTTTVELSVASLTYGTRYTLSLSGLRDRAQTSNTLAPNSSLPFTAFEYTPAGVGNPPVAGGSTSVPGGVEVTGSGTIGSRGDSFQFAYQPVTGDFDRLTRITSFTPTDPFATAGLMARAGLATNAPFAAILTTPAQLGTFLLTRATSGADAVVGTRYPANLPEAWLRLRRRGNAFEGFASLDGEAWTSLGSVSLPLPSTLFLGLATSSQDAARAATVRFRNLGDTPTTATTTGFPARVSETPGPSNRGTALVISEIMYHPAERADGRNTEFIEIRNGDLIDLDLTGFRLSGDIEYRFPDGYVLPAGGHAVIARQPADLAVIHGLDGVLGPFANTNSLPNSGGTVRLRNAADAILGEVRYDNRPPWPVAADGAGHSLVLGFPSFGEQDPRAWRPSLLIGGSPGTAEPLRAFPESAIVLNEILAHTDLPQLDFLELYNHGNTPVDLSGCILTDRPGTNRFRIPDGTRITPRGFVAFDEMQLGFRLDAAGESVFLLSSNLSRVIDAVRYGAQENGVSSGRFPDGTPEWRRLRLPSFAAENTTFRVSPVVINEVMYAPISGDDDDEFVELHNRTADAVDLSGWSLSDGIDFRFPAGTTLPGGGFLVVARNRLHLLARHPALAPGIVQGDYAGTLANGGERLALAMRDFIVVTHSAGLPQTNRIDIDVDEVTYGTGGRWGKWSDGLGSSLELVDPNSDHLRPSSWADSDESAKAPWTTIEFTGRVDNQAAAASRLHLVALGAGECLIDDIEVIGSDGVPRLSNGDFAGGLTGWTIQGNHRNSILAEAGGPDGGRALLVRTPGRGDTAVNRIRANLSPALAVNADATIRAKVRWLKGWPEFLFRTLGSGLEASGRLSIPGNLGTPGAPNSRRLPNVGPAIFDVKHSPPVPRANEPVVVSARVTDPDGVQTVNLRFRLDPSATLATVALRDDGTAGDAVAGDGIYSGTIAGRAANTLVAFRVEATDLSASPASSVFPPDAPAAEALVRWEGEFPTGSVGLYRFWQRTSDFNRLRSREALANDNLDCTFVYGDERVIYNAGMRAKGSPFHGGSVGGDYLFAVPEGDRLLGDRDLAIVTLGNLGSDPSAQREQAAFWIGEQLGVAALHRRHVRFYENGQFKGLYEDTQEPNGNFVDQRFPDGPDGDLFKIEDWFEFNDAGSSFVFSRDATLERFATTGGALKLARYRWSWRKRAVVQSSNDYSSFFQLVQALNGPSATYSEGAANLADLESWMRTFALQHIVGNWDSYGYNRGKNAYLYLPKGGRWQIIPWDIDFVLGSSSDSPTTDVFGSNDPTVGKLWNTPAFRRMYWRAFQDAVRGPLLESAFAPILDGRYAALLANGFNSLERPQSIKTWLNQRRQYLEGRLKSEDVATLEITSNGGANFSTNRNLATISGRAPIAVKSIEVNGVAFPVSWDSVSTWTLRLPLGATTNVLQFVGRDLRGNPVPGASDSITIRYTGTLPRPEDFLVINEIMYDPPDAGTAFVEIHNTSTSGAFDLSGWRLEGVDFLFPAGSVIRAGGFLVVAADLAQFRARYGTSILPIGEFQGALQNNGEILRLVQPGLPPNPDRVVDELRFDSEPPWPVTPRGLGPSLQLIDPLQDNRRVANWGAASTNAPTLATPGTANSLLAQLPAFPGVWLNEVQAAHDSGPRDAAGDRDPWIELHNPGSTTADLSGLYLASSFTNKLFEWAFPDGTVLGPGQFLVVWCDGEPGQTTAAELHASFRLAPTNGSVALVRNQSGSPAVLDYLHYRDLPAGKTRGSFPDSDPLRRQLFHLPTPGAANNPTAPLTQVFVNEWSAANAGAVLDPADGDPDDWFELYNAGAAPADLSSFSLTDDPTRPDKARIPNGTVIPPGGFLLVWADEEAGQSTNGQLHVNFKLSGSGESIALFAPDGTRVDAVSFGPQANNVAQGRFPDGAPEPFVTLDFPTPAAPNSLGTVNQPPVLAPIGNQTIDEGTPLSFRASATDPDPGQSLRFSLVGAPAGASIDPLTGLFTWPTSEATGPAVASFTVRVVDDGKPARLDAESITVTVRELNRAPVLDPIPDSTVAEGSPLSFVLSATDPDEPRQRLLYSLDPGAPAGSAIHPISGEFTWTPSEEQGPATYTVVVRVSDDALPALAVTRSFRLTVDEVDNPPRFDPPGLQSVEELATLRLTLLATDPDRPSKELIYVLENGPSGAALDPTSGGFTWNPTEADGPGSFNIVARVDQVGGGPSAKISFSVVVTEKNEAPLLAEIPNLNVAEGTLVRFKATATDADLPPQNLAFTLDPGAPPAASIDPTSGLFTWPVGQDVGSSTTLIGVRVTDNAAPARSAVRTFQVVVLARPRVVINELMYQPARPGAEFVELHNYSTNTTWDLGGWRLRGYDWVFPAGTLLPPGGYHLLVANPTAFLAAYPGAPAFVAGGSPQSTAAGVQDVILERPVNGAWESVSAFQFQRSAPWPTAAAGGGASLQLIDPAQDIRRVANWAALVGTTTNAPRTVVTLTNSWRYKQDGPAPPNWTSTTFNDSTWPSGRGLLFVEDAALPAPKNTPLVRTEGRLTYYFRTTFRFDGDPAGAALVLAPVVDDGFVMHLNGNEIYRLGVDPAVTVTDATPANRTVTDAIREGPFTIPASRLVAGDNVLAVEVHQVNATSSDIVWGASLDILEVKREPATPGFPNSVRANLPAFPELWINEILPLNSNGAKDNTGDSDPWIELANFGNEAIGLGGWWLTDDLANLAKWPLPANGQLEPGILQLIWADGEPAETSGPSWHASFRISAPKGVVALVREQAGRPAVVDYLEYDISAPDQSVGILRPSNPIARGPLAFPTPGLPNAANTTNRPPLLVTPVDATATAGKLFALNLIASDPDAGQQITYELATGAPEGLSLDRLSGRLTWIPATDQVGAHPVTVIVSDDATPRLAVRWSFTLTVVPASAPGPRITAVRFTSQDQLRIDWTTTTGRSYQLERQAELGRAWEAVGSPLIARGGGLAALVSTSPDLATLFFRVKQLP